MPILADFEVLRAMFSRAKIEYEVVDYGRGLKVSRGYNGFYTIYHFNPDGSLVNVGAYEE